MKVPQGRLDEPPEMPINTLEFSYLQKVSRHHACAPEDKIHDALQTMRQAKVRRLPVTNGDGRLQGIVSISDIVREAEDARGGQTPRLSYQDAVGTLKEVYRRRSSQQAAVA